MKFTGIRLAIACLSISVLFTGCVSRKPVDQQSAVVDDAGSAGRQAAGDLGTQCTPYGQTKSSGPKSYLVADVGKGGVPVLSIRNRWTIQRIEASHHSPTLRFAILDKLIVFDARHGPCYDVAGGYPVLNGACNEFYEPGEDPTQTKAAMGCL